MSEWTPGKWMCVGQTVYALDEHGKVNRFSTNMQGGYVNSGSSYAFGDAIVRTEDAELTANAHLIAAAPDLYEALKRVLAARKAQAEWPANDSTKRFDAMLKEIEWAEDAANAALARARGETE